MRKFNLGTSDLEVSTVGLGCMRMANKSVDEAIAIIQAALDSDINFFDHADIYGDGKSEIVFGEAIKRMNINRSDIIIQSKCGINKVDGTFDFSKEHILKSVDGILERLQMDYLDVLLLHRPDALVEPEEVAEAFKILKDSGKVKYFGVSNQSSMMIDLLQRSVHDKLIVNQMQFSLMHSPMVDYGMNVNMATNPGIDRSQGMIEYARLNNITIQAWSPFYAGFFEAVFVDNDNYPEVNTALQVLADKYNVSKEAIAVAWIDRHPANIQTIVGTTNPDRIKKISKVSNVSLSRKEWYDLYKSAGNILL